MKDIFNAQTINEFKERIQNLSVDSQAQWGKMNVYQMLKHCTENDRMLLQEKKFKRLFIGRLFGKLALRSVVKDASPLGKGDPTHPDLVIKESGNVELQKQAWLELLDKYSTMQPLDYSEFIHPFFGKMKHKEVSIFAFKHIDHHLRQFGV